MNVLEFAPGTIKRQRRQQRHATRLSVEEVRRLARGNAAVLRAAVYSAPPVVPAPAPHPVARVARVASQIASRMVGRVFRALRGR